jgi:hypothetical protein
MTGDLPQRLFVDDVWSLDPTTGRWHWLRDSLEIACDIADPTGLTETRTLAPGDHDGCPACVRAHHRRERAQHELATARALLAQGRPS